MDQSICIHANETCTACSIVSIENAINKLSSPPAEARDTDETGSSENKKNAITGKTKLMPYPKQSQRVSNK